MQTCTSSPVPSVPGCPQCVPTQGSEQDCSGADISGDEATARANCEGTPAEGAGACAYVPGVCAPIAAVGDSQCNSGGNNTAANFDCEQFFFDMGDCEQPQIQTVEAALELAMSENESAAILDTTSPARAAFEANFVIDIGRSLGVPSGSVRLQDIYQVSVSDSGRRRALLSEDAADFTPKVPLADIHNARRALQREGGGRDGGGRRDAEVPVVVTLVVEFEIEFENALEATAVVEQIAIQASDPTSPLRSANVTSAVTRADSVRLDEPASWVADLNEALVAASCEGQQLEISLEFGNVAWALKLFPEAQPIQFGSGDLAMEVFCVPEGVYSFALEQSGGVDACCTGDWTIKIKDSSTVLADGSDFTGRLTSVFVVGSTELLEPRCEEPPCEDVHSMGGFTCQELWLGWGEEEESLPGEPGDDPPDSPPPEDPPEGVPEGMVPTLNQACSLHPTLGDSVGVGWCKVRVPAAAYSGCDDPTAGSGCGDFMWDFCEVEDGLQFQVVAVNQGEVISNIIPGEFRYFLFDGFQGAPYTLYTAGYGLGDSVMYLYDTDGVTQIAYNDDYNGLQSQISWSCPTTGTYVVGVRGYSSSDSGGFGLTIDVVVPPNPCEPNPCMNQGVCRDLTYTFECDCTESFSGTTCNLPNMDGVDFAEVNMCPTGNGHSASDVGILSEGPGDYANNQDCGLHIETAEGTAVALTFTAFELEGNFVSPLRHGRSRTHNSLTRRFAARITSTSTMATVRVASSLLDTTDTRTHPPSPRSVATTCLSGSRLTAA